LTPRVSDCSAITPQNARKISNSKHSYRNTTLVIIIIIIIVVIIIIIIIIMAAATESTL